MCKIITFTDTKKLNLKKHVNGLANILLKTEKDGFGYAIEGDKGVFGEKCDKKHFKSRHSSKYKVNLPVITTRYSEFGIWSANLTGPGIFHGRHSTNQPGIINTHPMQRPDKDGTWHLIHNGVVTDVGAPYAKLTDNDSEDVLYRLMNGINEVERFLEGYYAFAAIDPKGQLHIARDGYATLHMAWSAELETYIIATTEELLTSVGKMVGAKLGPIDEIEEDIYLIMKGNKLLHKQYITPLGFTVQQSSKAKGSIGRELVPITGGGGELKSKGNTVSEAEWSRLVKALNSAYGGDTERLDDAETDYYKYRNEIDNMDVSYTITDMDGVFLKVHEFRKLDHISQELCTIIRSDGTVVELDDNLMYTNRLA
jgi:predicted glutamine amidotransferase